MFIQQVSVFLPFAFKYTSLRGGPQVSRDSQRSPWHKKMPKWTRVNGVSSQRITSTEKTQQSNVCYQSHAHSFLDVKGAEDSKLRTAGTTFVTVSGTVEQWESWECNLEEFSSHGAASMTMPGRHKCGNNCRYPSTGCNILDHMLCFLVPAWHWRIFICFPNWRSILQVIMTCRMVKSRQRLLSFRHQATQIYPGGLAKLFEIWRNYLARKWEYVDKQLHRFAQ